MCRIPGYLTMLNVQPQRLCCAWWMLVSMLLCGPWIDSTLCAQDKELGELAVEGLLELPTDKDKTGSHADSKLQELPPPQKPTKNSGGGVEVLDPAVPVPQVEDSSVTPSVPTVSENSQQAAAGSIVGDQFGGNRPLFPWEVVSGDSAAQLNRLHQNYQPSMDPGLSIVPYQADDFSWAPTPLDPYNVEEELTPYRGKRAVPTQRPWLELGREFYGSGLFPPPPGWFGPVNLAQPQFLVYGDFRTALGYSRNQLATSVFGRIGSI